MCPKIVELALVALKDVVISNTSQLPTSELEQRRMSYFFQDGLTGLYNEDYLLTVLNTPHHKYKSLNILDLKKFTAYNKKYGWEEGNNILRNFAKFLKKHFPQHLIIRYHGDDFIMLSKYMHKIDINELEFTDLNNSGIYLHITHHNIDKYFNFEEFKKIND